MIIVTGAAGFIGSALLAELQRQGYGELVAVDDFSVASKKSNWEGKKIYQMVDRESFVEWFSTEEIAQKVQFIFHIGARTNTAETDLALLEHLNVAFSKRVFEICTQHSIPLIYASSAATYGDGSQGFDDDFEKIHLLKPMNPYGQSKADFDIWVREQQLKNEIGQPTVPPFWAGFKFFNVFGPNEYHKGRMASVVYHAFNQIQESQHVKLFKSHRPDYENGKQKRDFIYVKDLISVLMYFFETRKNSGLYNLGTGTARTFLDLTKAVFSAMEMPENIEFVDMPSDIRETYQYFTEANMKQLREAGFTQDFTSLEDAVADYVNHYLKTSAYF